MKAQVSTGLERKHLYWLKVLHEMRDSSVLHASTVGQEEVVSWAQVPQSVGLPLPTTEVVSYLNQKNPRAKILVFDSSTWFGRSKTKTEAEEVVQHAPASLTFVVVGTYLNTESKDLFSEHFAVQN